MLVQALRMLIQHPLAINLPGITMSVVPGETNQGCLEECWNSVEGHQEAQGYVHLRTIPVAFLGGMELAPRSLHRASGLRDGPTWSFETRKFGPDASDSSQVGLANDSSL